MSKPSLQNIIESIKNESEKDLLLSLSSFAKIDLDIILMVDVSGSMILESNGVSHINQAVALAVILKEMCETLTIYATGGDDTTQTDITEKVPDYYGIRLANSLKRGIIALKGGGSFPDQAVDHISHYEVKPQLFIFISDGLHDTMPKKFGKKNAFINLSGTDGPSEFSTFPTVESFLEWLKDLSMS